MANIAGDALAIPDPGGNAGAAVLRPFFLLLAAPAGGGGAEPKLRPPYGPPKPAELSGL